MAVLRQPEKVNESLSQKLSYAWWYISIIPARCEAEVGGSGLRPDPGKKHKILLGK
jgi:hypothetical protein